MTFQNRTKKKTRVYRILALSDISLCLTCSYLVITDVTDVAALVTSWLVGTLWLTKQLKWIEKLRKTPWSFSENNLSIYTVIPNCDVEARSRKYLSSPSPISVVIRMLAGKLMLLCDLWGLSCSFLCDFIWGSVTPSNTFHLKTSSLRAGLLFLDPAPASRVNPLRREPLSLPVVKRPLRIDACFAQRLLKILFERLR